MVKVKNIEIRLGGKDVVGPDSRPLTLCVALETALRTFAPQGPGAYQTALRATDVMTSVRGVKADAEFDLSDSDREFIRSTLSTNPLGWPAELLVAVHKALDEAPKLSN